MTAIRLPVYNDIDKQDRTLVFDMESIGLLKTLRYNDPTSMHVICCKDKHTKEIFIFFNPYENRNPKDRVWLEMEGEQDGSLADGIDFLNQAPLIMGHNISGYDILAFNKVFPDLWKDRELSTIMDTYVASCVLDPERKPPFQAYNMGKGNVGPHSIEAHGIRIGRYKPEVDDWAILTDDKIHRCVEDIEIGDDYDNFLQPEWAEHMKRPAQNTGLTIKDSYLCELQNSFAIARQAERGFRLDTKESMILIAELDDELTKTEAGFRPHMPRVLEMGKPTDPQRREYWANMNGEIAGDTCSALATMWELTTKNGHFKKKVSDLYPDCRGHKNDYTGQVVGPYTPIRFKDVPMGNRDYVKQVLHGYGWVGVNYNPEEQRLFDRGGEDAIKPWAGKIDEESLEQWARNSSTPGDPDATIPDWCTKIVRWYILSSRRNQVLNKKDVEHFDEHGKWPSKGCRGLMSMAYNEALGMTASDYYALYDKWPVSLGEEWRVPAQAFPCATNTFRMRHKGVVNIPARGLYPLRYLFIAGVGKMIIGADQSGLELRMLAHYMNDPVYQDIILNGDIHTYNMGIGGIKIRDDAKHYMYADLYGAGLAKLARLLGVSKAEVQAIKERFRIGLPAKDNLITAIEAAANKFGYLLIPDGRRAQIRSIKGRLLLHTILNTLLQSTGSITMKHSLCIAEKRMIEEGQGLDRFRYPAWLANQHDEVQFEVPESEVEEISYRISAEDLKEEEKAPYIRDGKTYSAHVFIDETEGGILIKRYYHRAGNIVIDAMREAGEFLKLRCPTAGEYKIGRTWRETH